MRKMVKFFTMRKIFLPFLTMHKIFQNNSSIVKFMEVASTFFNVLGKSNKLEFLLIKLLLPRNNSH